MWSVKFHTHRMYEGYGSTMNGTVTVPTADELLKEKMWKSQKPEN